MGAAHSLYPFLADMKQAQPDGLAFTPKTIWNAVFREDPPPDVTPDNVGEKLGSALQKRLDERIRRENITDVRADTTWPYGLQSGIYGIKPDMAHDMLLADDKTGLSLGFADSFPVCGPALARSKNFATAEELGIGNMCADLYRLETPPSTHGSLTVGGGTPLNLSPDSIEDETERADYMKAKPNNSIIRSIMGQVRELCGAGEGAAAQRASVYTMLGQSALGQFKYLATLVGAGLDEHAACDIHLDRMENGDIRLRHETVEGSVGYGRVEFMISPDGSYRQTDFLIAHERPAQA
jgi:hypothetical protein